MDNTYYCGFVAIIGRSNVGKSTLFNRLFGKNISITSYKSYTTRYKILGVCTDKYYQVIYIDTPGYRIIEENILNQLMNNVSIEVIHRVDLILFVVDSIYWAAEENIIMSKLYHIKCPIILIINKIDKISNKNQLLKHIKFLSYQINFYDILPICTNSDIDINILKEIIYKILPKKKHQFPKSYITNCSEKFIVSEIIRKKLIKYLDKDLPYSVTVMIESFIYNKLCGYEVHGLVIAKKNSQKKIIIGINGDKIKKISMEARKEIENLFKSRVYLKLWVKVKLYWSNNEQFLKKNIYYNNNYS